MSGTLTDLWLTTACLLSFAGFLRFSGVVNIHLCDTSVHEEYIVLHIPQRPDEKGNEVVIARCNSVTCLVGKLEEYVRKLRYHGGTKGFVSSNQQD